MTKDITMVVCGGKDSSIIDSFGYNSNNKELHVVFKNKTHRVYSNVPKERFQFMACSDYTWIYYIKNIKEKFKENVVKE